MPRVSILSLKILDVQNEQQVHLISKFWVIAIFFATGRNFPGTPRYAGYNEYRTVGYVRMVGSWMVYLVMCGIEFLNLQPEWGDTP